MPKENVFLNNSLQRLEAGALEYGDKSFHKPAPVLLREVSEELYDVATWCAIWASRYTDDSEISNKLAEISKGVRDIHDQLHHDVSKTETWSNTFLNENSPGVGDAVSWLTKNIKTQ
jgi:dsDNA-specific endonuclease/ATPase MutS2